MNILDVNGLRWNVICCLNCSICCVDDPGVGFHAGMNPSIIFLPHVHL